jgi:hypothetical protein
MAARPIANDPGSGSFLSSLLLGLFLVLCVLIAVYTLGRPFLPREWVP